MESDACLCESCGEIIPDESPSHPCYDGGTLCKGCAPTFQDMLNHPDHFQGSDDEPMTTAEAKAIVDAHIASGGSLSDSMAI